MPENKVVIVDWVDLDVERVDFDEPVIIPEDDPVVQFCLKHFKLHGSRFFNKKYPQDIGIAPSTDWDFFCPSGLNYAYLLKDNGFEVCDRNPEYLDEGTEKIWYHPDVPCLQVVQKRNFHQYNALINKILPIEYFSIWKSFIKKAAPEWDEKKIRKRIQENMEALYFIHGL